MSFVPLAQSLEVLREGAPTTDRFGNVRPGVGTWESVQVASWWVDRSEEKGEDSVLRTITYLHAHFPPESAPKPSETIRTPDGSRWSVEGLVEDFAHGWHGWNPGLVVVHAKKVSG